MLRWRQCPWTRWRRRQRWWCERERGLFSSVVVSTFYFLYLSACTHPHKPTTPMDGMRHALHTVFKGAAEAVLPVRTESAFAERGVRKRQRGERVRRGPPASTLGTPGTVSGRPRVCVGGQLKRGACGECRRAPPMRKGIRLTSLPPSPHTGPLPRRVCGGGRFPGAGVPDVGVVSAWWWGRRRGKRESEHPPLSHLATPNPHTGRAATPPKRAPTCPKTSST